MKGRMPVTYLTKYVRKYYKLFLCALFFLAIEAGCDLLQPAIMSRIIDVGIKNSDLVYVLQAGGMMLGFTAIGAIGAVGRNNISNRVSQNFGAELRLDLFTKIQTLSYQEMEKFEAATLITRLTNDVTLVQNFVNGMMRIFVKAPLTGAGSIIMAILLDPQMGVVILAVVLVIIGLIYLNTRLGFPLFRRVQTEIDRLNGVTREYLSGVRVVKAFNRFQYESERFEAENDAVAAIQTTAMRITAVFSPAIALTVNLGIIVVLWAGGTRINAGSLQVGKVIAFINYMTQIAASLLIISRVFNTFVRARVSVERIGDVMNLPPETAGQSAFQPEAQLKVRPESHSEFSPVPGEVAISFEDVSFSYTGDLTDPVLKNISFHCRAGMTVGIIGSTGAGKTSLINLIPRFYEATAGTIRFGGVDIRMLDEHALRERIAVVPQKSTLFTGTILENLRWGDENASLEQVREAARIAEADQFITTFPEQYATRLGQVGVNLSGGQKQRLSIARALIRRPEVLILDDCTSAVDSITEEKIRAGLHRLSGNLLCLVVAQRISSVAAADLILVLDDGEIVGQGTHTQLLEDCPVYREIYLSQFGKGAL